MKFTRKLGMRIMSGVLAASLVLVDANTSILALAGERGTVEGDDIELVSDKTETIFEGNIASGHVENGTTKGVDWVIDSKGKLTVTGTGDFKLQGKGYADEWYGEGDAPAWYQYALQIESAVVNLQGATDAASMFYDCDNLISADLSKFDTSQVTDMSHMFDGCRGLKTLNCSGWDTGKVRNMAHMFAACASLSSLDVSNFNTENVENMSCMFAACSGLKSLKTGKLVSAKTTDTNRMFTLCGQLEELDVSRFDTSNVANMELMFNACNALTQLDVSGFQTGNVVNMHSLFSACSKLTTLDVSGFDTRNVTDMSNMFSSCESLGTLDVSKFQTGKVVGMQEMFADCSKLTTLDVSGFDTGNVTDTSGMFSGCSGLTELNVSGFHTEKVTEMNAMFQKCSNLTGLDLGSFDLSNVNGSIVDMFNQCTSIRRIRVFKEFHGTLALPVSPMKDETGKVYSMFPKNLEEGIWLEKAEGDDALPVSGYVVSGTGDGQDAPKRVDWTIDKSGKLTVTGTGNFKLEVNAELEDPGHPAWQEYAALIKTAEVHLTDVTDLSDMFAYCCNMTNADLTDLHTEHVTNMSGMFRFCESMESVDVIGFDTGRVTDMSFLFYRCFALKDLDLSHFNTENVGAMDKMFMNCRSLTYLDLSNFKTSKVEKMWRMFNGCESLNVLNVGSFDLTSCGDYEENGDEYDPGNMFSGCKSLKALKVFAHFPMEDTILLPVDPMYDSEKNTYSFFPANLEESIWLYSSRSLIGIEPKLYTITFDVNGGDALEVSTKSVMGASVYGTMPAPTRTGFIFEGWYTSASDGSKVTENTICKGAATLYAHWSKISQEMPEPEIQFENAEAVYIFTGSAMKPRIIVTYNDEELREGIDYTVKYTNNISANITESGEAIAGAKQPTVTVMGKGNLTGSLSKNFIIKPMNISDSGVIKPAVTTDKAEKAVPMLCYNGMMLVKNKDFTYDYLKAQDAIEKGWVDSVEDGVAGILNVTGIGNYTGNVKINVIEKEKSALKKFTAKISIVDKSALIYDGTAKTMESTGNAFLVDVRDSKDKTPLKSGEYCLVYGNNTDAGTAKVAVVGMGDYSGMKILKFTIKPADNARVDKSGLAAAYPYNNVPVTIDEDLKVTDANKVPLIPGTDYKLTYSANTKTGTAKCKVTFLGNYKGTKAYTQPFVISNGELSENTPGLEIMVGDVAYKGKAGAYNSTVYVSVNGVPLKKSDYVVTYYKDPDMQFETKKKENYVNLGEGEEEALVYVKISGKGSYAPQGEDAQKIYAKAVYRVVRSTTAMDLSKMKVTVLDEDGNKMSKIAYTGEAVEPQVKVEYKDTKTKKWEILPADQYEVHYQNNVNKGKATVILVAKDTGTVGAKTATFNIVSRNVMR